MRRIDDESKERWKPISNPPGIVNAYISNQGRVKYLNSKGKFRTSIGSAQNGGYLQVKLGNRKFCVHRLVANQWLVKKSQRFTVIHHGDSVRSNNFVDNLSWTTQMLNCSLRTNSSMCLEKKGRFFCKFIFDGKIVKSLHSYPTKEIARNEAMDMRMRMYTSAYNALIVNEPTHEVASGSDIDSNGVCSEPEI